MPYQPGPETSLPAPPPEAPPRSYSNIGLLAFILGFVALLIGASLATNDATWDTRLVDTLFFLIPCGLATLIVGVFPWRPGPATRILAALATIALLLFALLGGRSTFEAAAFYYFWLLPALGAVCVVGGRRHQWDAAQWLGATLAVLAVWRPIYLSLPDLSTLLTASGALSAYSVETLYRIVALKFLHETFFAVAGILLLYKRFPLVQTFSLSLSKLGYAFGRRESGIKRNLWIDTGLGCTTFLIALGGSLFLAFVLSNVGVFQSGADDSNVFANMTPALVVMLSLAAGIGEELLFRSLLQPYFERGLNRFFPGRTTFALAGAIFLQALLFGVVHAGYNNLLHVALPFVFGVLTGIVFRYWGIIPAIYAHVTIDIFAFGVDAIDQFPWMNLALTLFFIFNLVVGIAVPAYLIAARLSSRIDPPDSLPE